ncbi:hypothetical protein BJ138DRAFT_972357, partial [Hygrophoropsis aurantiaca]
FAVTGHWIEETATGVWECMCAVLGFTQLHGAHSGNRLGQALFKITERINISHKIGYITCDNASNNTTMM